ncbi:MAG: hypothetical protein NT069_10365 [Planctomycetota bacterium]|nr:hypothetical protein [Planctomycetota bacterium]
MRIRITVHPTEDRTTDLRIAARVRHDLWNRSPVEVDPDNPLHGTHRDSQGRAYLELSTDNLEEVRRVLREDGYAGRVDIQQVHEAVGEACQNCGNIAGPILPTICPNCNFRDISACPVCHNEVPRQNYGRISGELFRCPDCRSRVRLSFNEPMFLGDGIYNQPLVVVEQEEHHEIQV